MILGNDGNDDLKGGPGDDTLIGGPGTDLETGGDDDDVFDQGFVPDPRDELLGGSGRDTADYSDRTGDLRLSLDGKFNDGEAGEADFLAPSIEVILAGSGNDRVSGNEKDNVLDAGPGFDTLDHSGTAGGVTVDLKAHTATGPGVGNDEVYSFEKVIGGPGGDILKGRPGEDVLHGGPGRDKIFGGGGKDKLKGGAGDDEIEGGGGKDKLKGGAGSDKMDGGGGDDDLFGGAGVDFLAGGPGFDRCYDRGRTFVRSCERLIRFPR